MSGKATLTEIEAGWTLADCLRMGRVLDLADWMEDQAVRQAEADAERGR